MKAYLNNPVMSNPWKSRTPVNYRIPPNRAYEISPRSASRLSRLRKTRLTQMYTEQLAPLYPQLTKAQVRSAIVLADNNLHESRTILDIKMGMASLRTAVTHPLFINAVLYTHQKRQRDREAAGCSRNADFPSAPNAPSNNMASTSSFNSTSSANSPNSAHSISNANSISSANSPNSVISTNSVVSTNSVNSTNSANSNNGSSTTSANIASTSGIASGSSIRSTSNVFSAGTITLTSGIASTLSIPVNNSVASTSSNKSTNNTDRASSSASSTSFNQVKATPGTFITSTPKANTFCSPTDTAQDSNRANNSAGSASTAAVYDFSENDVNVETTTWERHRRRFIRRNPPTKKIGVVLIKCKNGYKCFLL